MTTSEKPKDFGRYLQAHRIRQGISLDAVSRLTRITKNTLKEIESEDTAHLPAPVFVKGFLKAYAEAVGADKDEALARYEATLQVSRKADQVQGSWQKQTSYFPKVIIALVLLGAVIAVTLYLAGSFSAQPGQERATPSETTTDVRPQAEAPHTQEAEPVPAAHQALSAEPSPSEDVAAAPAEKKRIMLKIIAVEPTWLKVITDDQTPKEYNLDVGDSLDLEAKTRFSLLIGNAAGVQLTLNGKSVPVPGKSGQVVTLQLP